MSGDAVALAAVPMKPGVDGASRDRSPYAATVLAFCERFGNSIERCHILQGLLRLRADLRANSFGQGFQWVDGSFVEEVESTRQRAPNDVDAVSFIAVGDPATIRHRAMAAPDLFDPIRAKASYLVDHYVIQLDKALDAPTTQLIAYWYSMWSHRRGDNRWKGFVQLSLSDDDSLAWQWLQQQELRLRSGGDGHGA